MHLLIVCKDESSNCAVMGHRPMARNCSGLAVLGAEVPLKFTIEIYETEADGSESLLHRTMVSALTPLVARKDARFRLAAWRHRGATHAKILNDRAEPIYKMTE